MYFSKLLETVLKNLQKLYTLAALGNPMMWLLVTFGNSFMTSLAAAGKTSRN
jgi:hypothetical protein